MIADGTFVSAFAGIEGTGLGLERAGWRCVAQIEVDPFCNRVRAKRYPGVAQFGDIRGFGDAALASAIGERDARSVELLCGGFPCQDLSIAGKRAGLAGSRSGLFYEFVRVARELQPTWVLVENVPGLLSSNGGRDFAIVLDELGDAGYFVEWRVLDSRWFGVPQRRRRVFIVGHLGGPSTSPVLFEPEGSGGDFAASDAPREDTAGTLGAGAPGARGYRNDLDSSGAFVVAHALTKTMSKHHDPDTDTLIAHTLRASGFDASEDGTGRGTPLVESFWPQSAGDMRGIEPKAGDVGSLHRKQTPALLTMREGKDGGGKGPLISEDQSLTLATGNGQTLFASSVRRLTPTECERLQGFPDGWTCLCSTDICTCPDGPRYAALGNAVTVNVAEWVGHRIRAQITDGSRSNG